MPNARSPDERRQVVSLFIAKDPAELRIYAWLRTFRKRSGAANAEIRKVLTEHLDRIGFLLTEEEAHRLLTEEGLEPGAAQEPTLRRAPPASPDRSQLKTAHIPASPLVPPSSDPVSPDEETLRM